MAVSPISTGNLDFSILQDAREPAELFARELELRDAACPDWRATTLADPGIVHLLLTAGVVGMQHGRLDVEGLQTQLQRVRRPSQGRNLIRALGTELAPPRAALASVTLTVDGSLAVDIEIPKGTVLTASATKQSFVVIDTAAKFTAGGSASVVVSAMHGEPVEEFLESSDGSRNQSYETISLDLIQNSEQQTIELYVGPAAGPEVLWAWVESFAKSGAFDLHYRTERLADGRTRFLFGDGQSGAVPAYTYRMRIAGVSGGGIAGNVGAREIDTLTTPLFDSFGTQLNVSVANAIEAEGGSHEQSLEQARITAPAWWRTQDRAVTLADYAALARKVPGVLDAVAKRVTTGTSISLVELAVLGDSASGGASSAVLLAVEEYVTARKSETDDLSVSQATLVPVDVMVLGRARRGTPPARVEAELYKILGAASAALLAEARKGTAAALAELGRYFFDLRARALLGQSLFGLADDVGGHAFAGDLYAITEATVGLANSDISRFTRVPVSVDELQRGTAIISGVTITAATVAERISIRWRSASAFRVDGSVSGLMGFGTLGAVFEDDAGRISFVTSGAPQFGDRAYVDVSPTTGNVRCEGQVFTAGTVLVTVV